MILQNLVPVLADTGRYRDAFRRGEEALRMAEELGHPAPIAWACWNLGYAYYGRGDVDQAIDLSARSLALARERDVHNLIQAASACLGAAHTLGGRATESCRARWRRRSRGGRPATRMELFALLSLGRAYLSAGRPDDAIERAREALAACRERDHAQRSRPAPFTCSAILPPGLEPPALEEASAVLPSGTRAWPTELGMRPLVAHCHLGLGKLYRRTGKREQAQEHLTTATTMYREMGMTYWLEQAEAELMELGA